MPCMESMQKRTPLREMVAAEVRAEIARQRRTARSVAMQLGWTAPYISRRLSGQTPFTLDDLDAISGALGVPMSRFLDLKSSPAGGGILPGTFTPLAGLLVSDHVRPGCPCPHCARIGCTLCTCHEETPDQDLDMVAAGRLGLAA